LWFLLFLSTTSALCFYGVYICLSTTYYNIIIPNRLLLIIHEKAFEPYGNPYLVLFQFIVYFEGAHLLLMALFLTLIGIVVLVFAGYHCSLIARNTTTNETFKWSNLRRHLRIMKQNEIQQQRSTSTTESSQQDSTHNTSPCPDIKHLENIYNRGIIANFKEVLFQGTTKYRKE